MEKGKFYVFYNKENKACVGQCLGSVIDKKSVFKLKNGDIRLSNEVHDELDTELTLDLFYKVINKWFRGLTGFGRGVIISHNDYEFKISIPRNTGENDSFGLDKVEEAMDNILEDFWSVQLHELDYNNISLTRYGVVVSFRVHDVHEAQFRFNEEEN